MLDLKQMRAQQQQVIMGTYMGFMQALAPHHEPEECDARAWEYAKVALRRLGLNVHDDLRRYRKLTQPDIMREARGETRDDGLYVHLDGQWVKADPEEWKECPSST